MNRKPEIFVIFERYTPLNGGYTTTHRLTTPLGLKRVVNMAKPKRLDCALRIRFSCCKDAEALGLRKEANGEWVTTFGDPIQVEFADEQGLDFPQFLELLFGASEQCRKGEMRRRRG